MYQGKLKFVKTMLLDPPIKEEDLFDKCCMICLDVATHPVCCSVCKSMYCLKCASIWKSENNQCPKKCHSPWNFTLHDSLHLTLKCPYGDKCPKSIPQNIVHHLEECELAPQEVKDDLRRRKNFQCSKDHILQFWIGTYEEMKDTECHQCTEKSVCRSTCRKCTETYCVNCRPPPCTKTRCPNNHHYVLTKTSYSYICDICGLRPALFDQKCYDDIKCNFGMCESCHARLPQATTIHSALNNYQQCSNSHDLQFLADPKQAICTLCQKQKSIERQCLTCNTNYCIICKPIRLDRKQKCPKKHTLKTEFGLLCTMCRLGESVMIDEVCGFSLCQECFYILSNHGSNLERVAGIFCTENQAHRLMQYPAKAECHMCKQSRICFLGCRSCKLYYCISCKPSNNPKEDYYGHSLKPDSSEEKQCYGCGNTITESMFCQSCQISLCGACYSKL